MTSEIIKIEVRATITIGSSFSISTPYIQSFSVNKKRNTPTRFQCSLLVHKDEVSEFRGGETTISAGTKNKENLIFTGITKSVTIHPYNNDPNYVIIQLAGVDFLDKLIGKRLSRRHFNVHTKWCSIDSVVRKGFRSGKFNYIDAINTKDGGTFESSSSVGYLDATESSSKAPDFVGPPAPAIQITLSDSRSA